MVQHAAEILLQNSCNRKKPNSNLQMVTKTNSLHRTNRVRTSTSRKFSRRRVFVARGSGGRMHDVTLFYRLLLLLGDSAAVVSLDYSCLRQSKPLLSHAALGASSAPTVHLPVSEGSLRTRPLPTEKAVVALLFTTCEQNKNTPKYTTMPPPLTPCSPGRRQPWP